jgi:hypothetical protein
MQLSPSFGSGSPSEKVQNLIRIIDTADPNSGAYKEDDLGESWGHAQFGGWREALIKWDDIGSPKIACQLIAAAVKTALVARVLCCEQEAERKREHLSPLSYLSDSYVELLTDQLWTLWTKANGVSHPYHSHQLDILTSVANQQGQRETVYSLHKRDHQHSCWCRYRQCGHHCRHRTRRRYHHCPRSSRHGLPISRWRR